MGIAMVKALIKTSDEAQEWNPMLTLVQGVTKENERKIVSEICSDNFVDFVFSKIRQILSNPDSESIAILENIFNFLISLTDKSSYFCQELTKDDNLLDILRLTILNDENFQESVVLLINNIGFQLENSYFDDEDIRLFLFRIIESKHKNLCVLSLMRFSSAEQIKALEDDICSIVPDVVTDFVHISTPNEATRYNSGIEEILKNILILCRNDQARINLIRNSDFNNCMIKIASDSNFDDYKDLLDEIKNLIGVTNSTFLSEIETD